MADPLYTRLLSTANRLIGQYGKPAIIRRTTKSGDPYNPTVSTVDYNVKYVETGYSIVNRDNTLIQQGDIIGLISMDGEVAQIGMSDILIIDGEHKNMVDLQPLNPGGVQLYTEFQAR